MQHSLYWLTNDLRLNDNPALNKAMQAGGTLTMVYVVDPAWFKQTNFQCHLLGDYQWTFINKALAKLNQQLARYNQQVQVLYGQPYQVLTNFIIEHSITSLLTAMPVASFERRQLTRLASQLPYLSIECFCQHTLFTKNQFTEKQLTDNQVIKNAPLQSFSQFRRFVEQHELKINKPLRFKNELLIHRKMKSFSAPKSAYLTDTKTDTVHNFSAGEDNALAHMQQYFTSTAPATYKKTRNELDGWQNSTKFSPYLAIGNLSPRQIWWQVVQYEATHVANESTYWIKFELLWREYFQWLSLKLGNRLFKFSGIENHAPLTSFYPERLQKWCHGNTPYPLVNACMRELNSTGFLSNRGRQIAASCLVNELQVDWRYGAAYFQQMLIDHDVASNWGNWQYIAGVGADTRGGRHFNIEKQTQYYDPQGTYINKWQGEQLDMPLDSVDQTDWPIAPVKEHVIDEK